MAAEECIIEADAIENQTGDLTEQEIGLINRLKEQENHINNGKGGSKTTQPKINWPPKMIEPREMSLGPFHGNRRGEALKLKLAAKFINYSCKTGETLLLGIKNKIRDLTSFFPADSYRGDDDPVMGLFVDGCAVLQFIFSYLKKELKDFDIGNDQAAVIRQDLFLLGNQIPFRVLKILINLISDSDRAHHFRVYIFKFVLGYNITEQMDSYEELSEQGYLAKYYDQDEPDHLLGLLHSVFVYGRNIFKPLYIKVMKINESILRRRDRSIFERPFRNVQELKEAGIKVKASDFEWLTSVGFTRKFYVTGQLVLPPLIVDNSTEQKLLNLVAYEMSLDDYERNCWVVSYVNLLDLLIDSEQDVKDLRAEKVLRNRLSNNDADVAQLFNRLGSSCPAPPRDEYSRMKRQLQLHFKRKSAVWVAQVYHDHFRSPWTVVALLAALIVLLLTGIQTWYAVNPKN